MPLSDAALRNAKPKDKPYKLADGDGLYLLIKPDGGRYWRLKYRFAGKEKVLALGVYPEVTLAEAREARDEARRLLKRGTDPSAERKERKHAEHGCRQHLRGHRTGMGGKASHALDG